MGGSCQYSCGGLGGTLCEWNGNGACGGVGPSTYDCDHCCGGSACTGTVHVENVMPDSQQYCFATDSWYTQQSMAYVNDGSQWYALENPNGWLEWQDEAGGFTVGGQYQCCYIDPCLGNQTCPTQWGNYPCICTGTSPWSAKIDFCGELDFVAVCQ